VSNSYKIQIFEELTNKKQNNFNRSAKKSPKINQVLINGLNDGMTLLKFLLCTKAKIGFHTTTRKASPSRYATNDLTRRSNEEIQI
jgi:hypothetical protein